jgi:hypothetical protein
MLGGSHPRARIELHDVAFVDAERLADAHDALREQWFGDPRGVHIDSWFEVDGVDGYQVRFSDAGPALGAPKLFFLNLGGYVAGEFGEAHRYMLVAAADAARAKARARTLAAQARWQLPHVDAVLDVDDCLPVDRVGGRFVHLVEGPHRAIAEYNDYIKLT